MIKSYFFLIFSIFMMMNTPAWSQDAVLIIRGEGKLFEQAVLGLSEELEEEFLLHQMLVNKKTDTQQVREKITRIAPRMLVLMDNTAISLYDHYQQSLPKRSLAPPSVSLMASFVDLSIKRLHNATGIFYEVPLVTSVVNLRAILSSQSFRTVGVINRSFMNPMIKLNQQYCERENIRLISHQLSNRRNIKRELKRALKTMRKNVDALWILNDNQLLNRTLLKSVWLPFAKKFKKPIITGVESLIHPKLKFGTFAVVPDPIQLGNQAAEMIFDARDNGWKVAPDDIQPPRSVYKMINLTQVKRLFYVDQTKLDNLVDKKLNGS